MSAGDISKSRTPPAIKLISTITFVIIGISGSIRLITVDSWQAGLLAVTLVSLCALLIIFFGDSVYWFDLKNLKVQMRQFEAARQEVAAKQEEVTRIALAIGEITVFLAAFHRRMGSERNHDLEQKWLHQRVTRMFSGSNISESERDQVFRWLREIEAMESVKDKPESMAVWSRIWDRVEEEIEEANKTRMAPAH